MDHPNGGLVRSLYGGKTEVDGRPDEPALTAKVGTDLAGLPADLEEVEPQGKRPLDGRRGLSFRTILAHRVDILPRTM